MNTGAVYLIGEDGKLSELREKDYESEDLFQGQLADHPDLLAGDRVDPDVPRRWLLVSREVGIPGDDSGAGRWSVDHLFLDQDGIPTLVEVKRRGDTRLRREVVGQMLDYAANCLTYWSADTIRANFESRFQGKNTTADEALVKFLGPGADSEAFWTLVRTNLQAGRLRLLFVADNIPSELQRIIEFLNKQMDPAQVLGVEIRQFADGTVKTLVPRVVGQIAQKPPGSAGRQRRAWDETTFMAELASKDVNGEAGKVAADLVQWARTNNMRIAFGSGATLGSLIPVHDGTQTWYSLFALWTDTNLAMQFGYLLGKPPFDEAKLKEFFDRIDQIPGISLQKDRVIAYPSFKMQLLSDSERMAKFKAALKWALDEITAAERQP